MNEIMVPASQRGQVRVLEGARLLANLGDGPGLAAHRRRSIGGGAWPRTGGDLASLLESVDLRGRGGAGFPLARKLRTALKVHGPRVVVVNAAEGEPASSKDSVLMLCKPHLVLDGAQIVAQAMNATEIHVVVPGERPAVQRAVRAAVAERIDADPVPMIIHHAEERFVAGESSAVLELLAGRPNLPVTTSQPSALSGFEGRPTVLSNAETYAQTALLVRDGVDAYWAVGTSSEPGTRIFTVDGDGDLPTVLEVAHGVRIESILEMCGVDTDTGVLLGGYHGTWLSPASVAQLTVSAPAMADVGAAIGAGVLLPLRSGACPVRRTAAIVSYLAGESANRCGPCRFGLPALGSAMRDLALGVVHSDERIAQLANAVEGRGACHHPDGTTRSIRSLASAFPEEVAAHLAGTCALAQRVAAL